MALKLYLVDLSYSSHNIGHSLFIRYSVSLVCEIRLFGLCIVYPATTIPVALYMLKGYFSGLPSELDDAGLMDGLTRWQIILKISIPLSVPAIASVALYVFMIAWNEFLFAFMFLDDVKIFTLSRGIVSLDSTEVPRQHLMAAAVVATVPVLFIFLWFEKFLVSGLTSGKCERLEMNEMIKEAINVLKENDRGGYTVPTSRLYPFQWNWDSGFTAMGLWHFNKWRAWLEIISLLDAQWENGMIPHIVFRQNDPDYYPGPDIWHSDNEPPTSCISQPPVLATIVWQMVEKGTPYDTRKAKEIFSRLMASHRWFMDARDPVDKGIIATVHPWETGRDNCPDWDLGLSNVEVPAELESYIRRDTTHVETEQRPTQQEYDKYMAIVHFGKKVGWNNETIYRDGPFLMADPGIHFILLRATKDLLLLAKHLNMEASI
jgi:hypothetical protein